MKREIIKLETSQAIDETITIKQMKEMVDQIFDSLGKKPETAKDYKYRIDMFLDFLKKNGQNINSYRQYKQYLAGKTDYAVSTKNKYLTAAKILLQELNRLNYIKSDITINCKGFIHDKKHKRDGLNDEEMGKLSETLKKLVKSPHSARLRAIISLLALQGLRQIEIIRLDVKDIDLINKTAFVQGKGRDDKEPIDLHPETVNALKDYTDSNKKRSGALFTSNSNRGLNQRLTTRSLRRIVKDELTKLNIEKSTHGFRHWFTTTLIKTYKGDLLEVSQYTRHRGLEMLQVYNDAVKKKADLPRYYGAFNGVKF